MHREVEEAKEAAAAANRRAEHYLEADRESSMLCASQKVEVHRLARQLSHARR